MRLHIKLILLIVVLAVAIGGTCALLVSNVMQDTLEQELKKRGVVIAQTMAEHVTHSVIDGEVVAAREVLQEIVQQMEDVEFAYVAGFDGDVFAHSFEDGFPRGLLPDEPDLIRADAPHLERYSTKEGFGLLVGYPLIDGMKAHLHVGLNETYLHAQIERTRNGIVGITFGVALVTALLGIFMSHRITRPLEQLSASLRAFAEKRIEREIEYLGGGREVTDLTHAFNQMIAARVRAEARIEHLNTVLRAIRKVNQLIVREKDRDRLLQSACDTLIETRGYDSAWVALTDESGEPVLSEAEGVVTTAEAGLGDDFTPMVEQLGRGEWVYCARQALAQAGALGIENPPSTCTDCPLSSGYGGRGGMAVRLEHGGKVYGLLTVSVPADLVADEEERSLLEEVAGDIAFALRSIELEEERQRAEEALQEYSERLEEMVEERTQALREAQEQLVRREKLAVLGQLAGGVGHELRNPLGVISNAIYFLQMTLADAGETTGEYLSIISSEVRGADKIVSDLLDFSRTRLPEREEMAVSELVAQVLAKRPPPENVEVTTETPADLPPVFVDPRQMRQVLDNLVANGYQAMPEGGELVISVQTEEGQVALSISDTGCGISEENMDKLFEPLFTTKARGIGLGLVVSKNLVEANGGSIEVESEVGKGGTFTVKLPLVEAKRET